MTSALSSLPLKGNGNTGDFKGLEALLGSPSLHRERCKPSDLVRRGMVYKEEAPVPESNNRKTSERQKSALSWGGPLSQMSQPPNSDPEAQQGQQDQGWL